MHPLYLLILVIVVIALLPVFPYSRGWGLGFYPSGGIGLVLLILVVLLLMGRL